METPCRRCGKNSVCKSDSLCSIGNILCQNSNPGQAPPQELCLRLYSTVDGVPEHLLPLNKEILGDAFAKLASARWGQLNVPEQTDTLHWTS